MIGMAEGQARRDGKTAAVKVAAAEEVVVLETPMTLHTVARV